MCPIQAASTAIPAPNSSIMQRTVVFPHPGTRPTPGLRMGWAEAKGPAGCMWALGFQGHYHVIIMISQGPLALWGGAKGAHGKQHIGAGVFGWLMALLEYFHFPSSIQRRAPAPAVQLVPLTHVPRLDGSILDCMLQHKSRPRIDSGFFKVHNWYYILPPALKLRSSGHVFMMMRKRPNGDDLLSIWPL